MRLDVIGKPFPDPHVIHLTLLPAQTNLWETAVFFILPLTLTRLIWSFFSFLTAGGLPGATKRTFDGRVEETASAEWLPGGFFS